MMQAEDHWTRKDLIGIEELSRSEIEMVHALAAQFKQTLGRSQKKLPTLRTKHPNPDGL